MLGLRRLFSKIFHSKAGQVVEHVALDLVTRPGFQAFIEKYKDTGEQIVKEMLDPTSKTPIQAIFTDGVAALKGQIKDDLEHFHDGWAHQLIGIAYEEIVAAFGKPARAQPLTAAPPVDPHAKVVDV